MSTAGSTVHPGPTLWTRWMVLVLGAGLLAGAACSPIRVAPPPGPAGQFPSPMEESVRSHRRVERQVHPGLTRSIERVLPAPVDVFVPSAALEADSLDVVLHFHGAAYVVQDAAAAQQRPVAVATVNLGAGSAVYERPFLAVETFGVLVDSVRVLLPAPVRRIFLTSWSAGYGAVRAILRASAGDIDGILLLDGLHTDYVPDSVPLAAGGSLNTAKMEPFLWYAERAVAEERQMLITHSEIFPGTYASTTETATWIADMLGLRRSPVLDWGPSGMQQLSEASLGHLTIQGFAGNTAPDHVDHLHGLSAFMRRLLAE